MLRERVNVVEEWRQRARDMQKERCARCEWRVCAGRDWGLTIHLMRNTQSYSLLRDLLQLLESSWEDCPEQYVPQTWWTLEEGKITHTHYTLASRTLLQFNIFIMTNTHNATIVKLRSPARKKVEKRRSQRLGKAEDRAEVVEYVSVAPFSGKIPCPPFPAK